MNRLMLTIAITCPAILLGIAGGDAVPAPKPAETPEIRPLPMIERKDQIAAARGKSVRVKGRYVVTSTGPHPIVEELPDGRLRTSSHTVSLELADGTRVSLGPRPQAELEKLDGKTAIATGVLKIPARNDDPKMAAPDPVPILVEISEVVPAAGPPAGKDSRAP